MFPLPSMSFEELSDHEGSLVRLTGIRSGWEKGVCSFEPGVLVDRKRIVECPSSPTSTLILGSEEGTFVRQIPYNKPGTHDDRVLFLLQVHPTSLGPSEGPPPS